MTEPDRYHRRARVRRVVDGDTIELAIDQGWGIGLRIGLRLADIDCPETAPRRSMFDTEAARLEHRRWGNAARQFTTAWLEQRSNDEHGQPLEWPLLLTSDSIDPNAGGFGRSIGDLWHGDASLRDALVLARYDTGRRWTASGNAYYPPGTPLAPPSHYELAV